MAAPEPAALEDLWLAEAVRLREEHWGQLEDQDAVRQARNATTTSIESRVLLRARLIGKREGLAERLDSWRRGAWIAMALLLAAAALAGLGTAWSALGDPGRTVNVVWALGALLGLHTLTFMLWLASFALPAAPLGNGWACAWLWLTRRLARGPDAALPAQALLTLVSRGRASRWLFGTISHLVWLVALLAAVATLLAVLSTARYQFAWATTLLAPDAFVELAGVLGWLPARVGFAAPDAAVVRLSDGSHALPAGAHAAWAWWLVGLVVVYGVVPRLAAWALSTVRLRRALRLLRVDMALPGFAALRARLQPQADTLDMEGDAPAPHQPHLDAAPLGMSAAGQTVLAGLELPDDIAWPPPGLPASVRTTASLDNREQRNALLDALAAGAARRLLIAVDARQTPDRGSLALIVDLAGKAAQTGIWIIGSGGTAGTDNSDAPTPHAQRHRAWRTRLMQAGLGANAIMDDSQGPLQWLDGAHG